MLDNQFDLLKTRRFLPLFITQFFQAFNDCAFKNAMVILITYRLASNSSYEQILVSAAAGIFILPFFLFSATAGQLADKYDKTFLIRIIKVFEILFSICGAIGFFTGSVSLLMFTLFLMGVHSAFFGPIKYAILPDHLKRNELISANALIEASTFIAILVGSIFGSLFILTTPGLILVSGTVIALAFGGLFTSFYIPRTQPASPDLKVNVNFLRETWAVIRHTRMNRPAYLSILGISWFWLVGAIFLAQFPTFAKDALGAQASVVTIFLAMFSIGIAIGSLLCNKLLKGSINSNYVPLGIFLMSLFIIDLYFTSGHAAHAQGTELISAAAFLSSLVSWHILLDIFGIAVCGGIYIVPLYAIMQITSKRRFRSRTIACNNIINSLFMVGAALFTMLMLGLNFSIREVFLIMGVMNAVVALYICKLLPEKMMKKFVHDALKYFYQIEVRGLENYPRDNDRVIIISNHTSMLDTLLLSTFLPGKYSLAVNERYARKWWVKPFLGFVKVLPTDPSSTMATKGLIKELRAGSHCIIFPEGRLTESGSLLKVYDGPGIIVDKTQATVIPVRIDGAQFTSFSRQRGNVRLRWFPKITLTVLPEITFSIDDKLSNRDRRRAIGTQIYMAITDLVFQSSDYHRTLFEVLLDARTIHGNDWVIMEDTDRNPLNYGQMLTRVYILGKKIQQATRFQEHVGVLLPTTNTAIITFYALHAFGRIPAMLNFSSGAAALIGACKSADVKTIYTARKFVEAIKLHEVIEALVAAGLRVVYLEDFRHQINVVDKLRGAITARFARMSHRPIAAKLNSKNTAVVLFTSGSEGTPKGVALAHENLLANIYQMVSRVDFSSSDRMFNAMPVFHSFGLTVGAVLPMSLGMRTFFYPSPLHFRVVPELVYATNATIMFGTDTFLTGYAHYANNYDFVSIRFIFAGAEKLKEETRLLYAEKFGVRVYEGYGATETSPVVSTNTPLRNKPGTVGVFLPAIEHRLVPVEGISEGGRLWVKGPNIMSGYLRSDDKYAISPPPDGWYDTGDIVSVDEEGFIRIQGRAKRFAKIGGEMVSLTAVETFTTQLWPEHQHAAVSVPDPKRGEQIVLLSSNPGATREEIVRFAQQNGINELSIPKRIIHIEAIPVLATGKVDYPGVARHVAQACA